MLNDENSGSLGGLTSMLGQFGLGMGSSESNIDRIMELARARVIAQASIFQKDKIADSEDYIANHLISDLRSRKMWASDGLLNFGSDEDLDIKDFNFTHDSVAAFTLSENKALKKLYIHLVGKNKLGGAFATDYSELSGIMNFHVSSADPELSVKLVNNYYDELSAYYLEKTNEKRTKEYELIKSKYDSIQTALNKVQYSLADFEDRNRGLYRRVDNVREKKLRGEEMKLFAILEELEEQLQLSQLAMENNQAYIQLIDRPILPLKPVNKGRLYYFLLGGLLGGILSITYLLIKKIYRNLISG